MEEKITLLLLAAIVILFIILLLWFIRSRGLAGQDSYAPKKDSSRQSRAQQEGLVVNCPMCSLPLAKGQDLVSRVYRPMNVSDQLCTIHGCPHCYPRPELGVKRMCPVCHREVPVDGHLIARLFNKTDGKKHVIVTGCTECSRGVR